MAWSCDVVNTEVTEVGNVMIRLDLQKAPESDAFERWGKKVPGCNQNAYTTTAWACKEFIKTQRLPHGTAWHLKHATGNAACTYLSRFGRSLENSALPGLAQTRTKLQNVPTPVAEMKERRRLENHGTTRRSQRCWRQEKAIRREEQPTNSLLDITCLYFCSSRSTSKGRNPGLRARSPAKCWTKKPQIRGRKSTFPCFPNIATNMWSQAALAIPSHGVQCLKRPMAIEAAVSSVALLISSAMLHCLSHLFPEVRSSFNTYFNMFQLATLVSLIYSICFLVLKKHESHTQTSAHKTEGRCCTETFHTWANRGKTRVMMPVSGAKLAASIWTSYLPAQAQGRRLSCTVAAICALQTTQHSAWVQVQRMAATAPSSSLLVAPAQAQGKKLSCTVAAICALPTTQHSACLQVQQMAATAPSSSLLVAPAQAQDKMSCTVAAICALQTTQHSACLQVQQMAATAPSSSLLVAPAQAQDKMSCTVAAICALPTTQHSACLQVQQMAATAPSSSLLVAPAQAQDKMSCTVAAICALQTTQHSACLQV